MKKILSFMIIFNFIFVPVLAADLDLSVDEDIRRNYNPSKLEEDMLPPLPSILINGGNSVKTENPVQTKSVEAKSQTQPQTQPQTKAQKTTSQPQKTTTQAQKITDIPQQVYTKSYKGSGTIKKGTKFKTRLYTALSDKSPKGGRLTLVSTYPVTTTCLTIPSGAHFSGVVLDSHSSQFLGNGGLLVIKVDKLILNGASYPINAYVTKTNKKKIFLNNIKGKQTYLKSIAKSINPGKSFFSKMMNVTVRLAHDGASIILTPFSIASGVIVLGFNTVMSPVFAMFSKGGALAIPTGTIFEIKLLDDLV